MLESSLSPVIEESEGAVGGSVQYHILAHMLDQAGLERMGYKQELRRDLTAMRSLRVHVRQNFYVSFSVISVISGVSALFHYGLITGGPAVMVWGWVFPSSRYWSAWLWQARHLRVQKSTTFVIPLSEICSAHPTSGGPYYWAAAMSKPRYAPITSWVTGWFSLFGQAAVTTGISNACANFIITAATINTNYEPTPLHSFFIFTAVLFAQGIINTFGMRILKPLSTFSFRWHVLSIIAVILVVLVSAPTHQSGSFVFERFIDNTGLDGIGWSEHASPAYVAVIGILMAQYALTGFDASAYMTEETHNAAVSAPIGIVMSITFSAVLGWFLILALLFSIQDYDATVESGQPVVQIFLDTVGDKGAIILLVTVIMATFFCGRDGALPCSKFLHKVGRWRRSPTRTVWLSCALSFVLGWPMLYDWVVFSTVTSIAAIGLYLSYGTPSNFIRPLSLRAKKQPIIGVPIALRVINADKFARGPFHLGKLSYPIAVTALLWIALVSVVLCLPQVYPVDSETFNYAPASVALVLTLALFSWVAGARRRFVVPVKQDGDAPGAVDKTQQRGAPSALP
ncbi:amino acid permease-domain-containing protein [Russula brevipes]|nr:amino acid permease-domain-containing protein [Russula brevipes]